MVSNISNLNPKSKKIKHIIAIVGTYMMFFGFIFTVLELLFGFIPVIRDTEIYGIPIAPIVFALVSIIIISKYIKISSIHKED